MNNDLLLVVVSYATTKLSFDLLTSFAPHKTYDVSVWKQKSLVENRGLVPAGGVGFDWYAFYLACNKTFYGNVMTTKLGRAMNLVKDGSSTIVSDDIVLFHHAQRALNYEVTLVQRSDYTIVLYNSFGEGYYLTLPFDRRIRSASIDKLPPISYDQVAIVDEYGDVWYVHYELNGGADSENDSSDYYSRDDDGASVNQLIRYPTSEYIVSCSDYLSLLLARDGTILAEFGENTSRIALDGNKIIYQDESINLYNQAVSSDNKISIIQRRVHGPGGSRFTASTSDELFIAPSQSPLRYNPTRAYQDNANILTTTARTIYHTRVIKTTGHQTPPIALKDTIHRTQYARQVYDTVYAILDPL